MLAATLKTIHEDLAGFLGDRERRVFVAVRWAVELQRTLAISLTLTPAVRTPKMVAQQLEIWLDFGCGLDVLVHSIAS
jgi:hypothetical protein